MAERTESMEQIREYLENRGWDIKAMTPSRIIEVYDAITDGRPEHGTLARAPEGIGQKTHLVGPLEKPIVEWSFEDGTTSERVRLLFEAHDIPYEQTYIEQFEVFMEAMVIFAARDKRRKGLWQRYGWMDSLMHIRSKAARAVQEFWGETSLGPDTDLDDALDLLNYTVFFIRNFRKGNKFGDM